VNCSKCHKPIVCQRCFSAKGGSRSTEAKRAASQITLAKARAEKKRKAALPCTSHTAQNCV
jgi:hypothetical protein